MAETVRLTGGCQCGAIRYALASRPSAPGLCHCRMCQKASGGPFMVLAGVPDRDVTWTRGALSIFHSSNLAERGFCAACGTPLTYRARPDRISFSLGSFDDPKAIVPVEQFDIDALLPWTEHIAALPPAPPDVIEPGFVNHQHPDHDT